MDVIIVYDKEQVSTRIISKAIGDGFGKDSRVRIGDAKELTGKVLPEIDVLIVGTYTRRSKTSKVVRDFLKNLPKKSLVNVSIGAFETRQKRRFLFSTSSSKAGKKAYKAAQQIEHMLLRKGGIHVLEPQRYYFRSNDRVYRKDLMQAKEWGKEFKELSSI